PDASASATITLSDSTGKQFMADVAPGAVLPIYPQMVGFADHSVETSGVSHDVFYHLQSSRPIVAYQFNPLDDVGVFSNDASLLIPSDTFDRHYLAVSYWSNQMAGYVTIVASSQGVTHVTVHATAAIRAGRDQPAIPQGGTATITLTHGDVVTFEA